MGGIPESYMPIIGILGMLGIAGLCYGGSKYIGKASKRANLLRKLTQGKAIEDIQSVRTNQVQVEAKILNIDKAAVETQEKVQKIANKAAKDIDKVMKQDDNAKIIGDLNESWN